MGEGDSERRMGLSHLQEKMKNLNFLLSPQSHRGRRENDFLFVPVTPEQTKRFLPFGLLTGRRPESLWRIGISSPSQRLYEPAADSP